MYSSGSRTCLCQAGTNKLHNPMLDVMLPGGHVLQLLYGAQIASYKQKHRTLTALF
jgi:hypothetical protein